MYNTEKQTGQVGRLAMAKSSGPRRYSIRGVALIIVLCLITMLAIMIIGFMSTIRIEFAASRNFNNLVKTRHLTESALADAKARLLRAAPKMTTDRTWVSAPGMVYTITNGQWQAQRLFSFVSKAPNEPDLVDWQLQRNNLNKDAWITGENSYYGKPMYYYLHATQSVNAVRIGAPAGTPAGWQGWAKTNWSILPGWETIDTNGWISGVMLTAASTNISSETFGGELLQGTAFSGCANFGGTLGMDFDVLAPVQVAALGAYDHLGDGIKGSITVTIYNRTTQAKVVTDMVIGPADVLQDSSGLYRLKNYGTPPILPPGQYTVAAWGFNINSNDRNGGVYCGSPYTTAGGSLFGIVSTSGSGRYSGAANTYPNSIDDRGYHAGNVIFASQNLILTNITPAVIYTNTLTGRLAYWVDDEACKVNINVAKYRAPEDINQSVVTNIDLRGLEPPFGAGVPITLDQFHASGPYTTIEEARLGFSPTASLEDFQKNKFFTTVYTKEANTDAFGRQRVDITALTAPTGAGATAFRSRMNDPLWRNVIYSLVVTTNRATLAAKYGDVGVDQIVANIAEYQRAYNANVPPFSSALTADGIPSLWCALQKGPLLESVIVHVTTNAVIQPASGGDPEKTNLQVRVFVDPKLVNGFDVARGNGYVLKVKLDEVQVEHANPDGSPSYTGFGQEMSTLQSAVDAYSFALASRDGNSPIKFDMPVIEQTPGMDVPLAQSVKVRLAMVRLLQQNNDANIVDWMLLQDFTNAWTQTGGWMVFSNRFDAAVTNVGVIQSYPGDDQALIRDMLTNKTHTAWTTHGPLAVGKHDPRVRTFPGRTPFTTDFAGPTVADNTDPSNPAYNTVYGPNFEVNWSGFVASQVHPVDDDVVSKEYSSRLSPELYGLLANTRAIFPGAAFTSHRYFPETIKEALIESVGELSDIHTGYPWRTIRFRSVVPATTTDTSDLAKYDLRLEPPYTLIGDPNTGLELVEVNALADWILLDAVTVGQATEVTGRININQKFNTMAVGPFGNLPNPARGLDPRIAPLKALLANTTTDLISTNEVIVQITPGVNIQAQAISATGFYNMIADTDSDWKSFGYRFWVTDPVEVTKLGVFDNLTNGIMSDPGNIGPANEGFPAGVVTVRICDLTNKRPVVGPVAFYQGVNYPLDPGNTFRMQDITPVTLSNGYYTISSYTLRNPNRHHASSSGGIGLFTGDGTYVQSAGQMYQQQSYDDSSQPNTIFSNRCTQLIYGSSPWNAQWSTVNATFEYRKVVPDTTNIIVSTGYTSTDTTDIARNISMRLLTSGSPYAGYPVFGTSGEICEVAWIDFVQPANSVGGVANTFERQKIIRRIANLITVRSNAYTFWGMGELIKDRRNTGKFDWTYRVPTLYRPADAHTNWMPPVTLDQQMKLDGDGDTSANPGYLWDDFVLGRIKYQSVIERYEDDGTVKVRTLYNRFYTDEVD